MKLANRIGHCSAHSAAAQRLNADLPARSDEELFQDLREASAAQAETIREALVTRHSGLVRWLAGHYANNPVDVEDLRQVGYLGLVTAIDRFDVDRGYEFVSFARPTVQGEIRRYFRDERRWVRMPRRIQENKAAIRVAAETLTHDLHRVPNDAELAEYLGLPEPLVREAAAAQDTFAPVSLDAPAGNDGEETFTIADTVGFPDTRLDFLVDCDALKPLVEELSDRDRLILHLRYYQERTQSQIGQELGCSQMQISRVLAGIHDRLRAGLTDDAAAA